MPSPYDAVANTFSENCPGLDDGQGGDGGDGGDGNGDDDDDDDDDDN